MLFSRVLRGRVPLGAGRALSGGVRVPLASLGCRTDGSGGLLDKVSTAEIRQLFFLNAKLIKMGLRFATTNAECFRH